MVNVCGFASHRMSVTTTVAFVVQKQLETLGPFYLSVKHLLIVKSLLEGTTSYETFPDHDKWEKLLSLLYPAIFCTALSQGTS